MLANTLHVVGFVFTVDLPLLFLQLLLTLKYLLVVLEDDLFVLLLSLKEIGLIVLEVFTLLSNELGKKTIPEGRSRGSSSAPFLFAASLSSSAMGFVTARTSTQSCEF